MKRNPVQPLCQILLLCLLLISLTACNMSDDVTDGAIDGKTDTAITTSCTVTRVVDGDTIVVNLDGKSEKVRLIGVDTPESVHPNPDKNVPYGKVASAFTKEQLLNKKVTLEFDVDERDRYGRLLAYVYLDGEMFNKTLLEKGHAKVATFPPNVKYEKDFIALEKIAKEQNLGLWKDYDDVFADTGSQNIHAQPENSDQATPATANNANTDGNYLGNATSKKLHLPECRGAATMSNQNKVWFDSVEEAQAQNYTACGICKPF